MTQKELEDLIIKYQAAYYDGNELVSDATYDRLYDELEQKYPDSYLLKKVGEDTIKGKKIKHWMVMGSQAKFNTEEALKDWISKENISFPVLIQNKVDGCLDFNTILDTDKGPLKIGDIVENKIKCKVKALDLETNQEIFTPITNWYINNNDFEWYELETDKGQKLKITGNHKVYLPKLHCWREVQDLKEGDEFLLKES